MEHSTAILPSKKLSSNARAQISHLQEGNHQNSNYICNGQQNPLSSRSVQCTKHTQDLQSKCNHCKRVNNKFNKSMIYLLSPAISKRE